MALFRIALANLRYPANRDESVAAGEDAIARAAAAGAELIAFPECFVPGYRTPNRPAQPPDGAFLERAWARLAAACGKGRIVGVVGSERVVDGRPLLTAVILDAEGRLAGFQDKVQLDPSEEGPYVAGSGRHAFRAGPLTFGVVICHEGWRYPETVRAAVRRGAQLVLHPHFHEGEPDGYAPTTFGDPANSFHEGAVLCRAAENTCYFASINYASPGSPTTSAVARPDGTLLAYQPYGREGLLVVDIDLAAATGLLAARCKIEEYR
jgi:predicted amidohydrolase